MCNTSRNISLLHPLNDWSQKCNRKRFFHVSHINLISFEKVLSFICNSGFLSKPFSWKILFKQFYQTKYPIGVTFSFSRNLNTSLLFKSAWKYLVLHYLIKISISNQNDHISGICRNFNVRTLGLCQVRLRSQSFSSNRQMKCRMFIKSIMAHNNRNSSMYVKRQQRILKIPTSRVYQSCTYAPPCTGTHDKISE